MVVLLLRRIIYYILRVIRRETFFVYHLYIFFWFIPYCEELYFIYFCILTFTEQLTITTY